jgi:pimeloyl-ACP methyl ester carboxylesterase
MARAVPLVFAVVLLAACSGSSGQAASSSSTTTTAAAGDGQRAPEPDSFEVDGRQVGLDCEGSGEVPIVLLAGGSDPGSVWDDLVERLGPDRLTCVFDRPGVATSDPPPGPTTPGQVADTLAATLDASGLDGPFVFVGHSLAGPTVRQLGASHPDLLAGAVLLDPTTKLAFASVRSDLEETGWDYDATVAEANAAVTWPDVGLVVLSHDPSLLSIGPEAIERLWTEGQQEYASLTSDGRQEAVTGSSHYVYRDAPDRVVEAIASVTP